MACRSPCPGGSSQHALGIATLPKDMCSPVLVCANMRQRTAYVSTLLPPEHRQSHGLDTPGWNYYLETEIGPKSTRAQLRWLLVGAGPAKRGPGAVAVGLPGHHGRLCKYTAAVALLEMRGSLNEDRPRSEAPTQFAPPLSYVEASWASTRCPVCAAHPPGLQGSTRPTPLHHLPTWPREAPADPRPQGCRMSQAAQLQPPHLDAGRGRSWDGAAQFKPTKREPTARGVLTNQILASETASEMTPVSEKAQVNSRASLGHG